QAVGPWRLAPGDAGAVLWFRDHQFEERPHELQVSAAVRVRRADDVADAAPARLARWSGMDALEPEAGRRLVAIRRGSLHTVDLAGTCSSNDLHSQPGNRGLRLASVARLRAPRRLLRRHRPGLQGL